MKRKAVIAASLVAVLAVCAVWRRSHEAPAPFDPVKKFQQLAGELEIIQKGGDVGRFRALLIETSETIDQYENSKPTDPNVKFQAIGFRSHLALTMGTVGMKDEASRLMQRSLDESEALQQRFPAEPRAAELVRLVGERKNALVQAK